MVSMALRSLGIFSLHQTKFPTTRWCGILANWNQTTGMSTGCRMNNSWNQRHRMSLPSPGVRKPGLVYWGDLGGVGAYRVRFAHVPMPNHGAGNIDQPTSR